MKRTYYIGETIILSIEIKDKDGNLKDPATSVGIEVTCLRSGTNVLPLTEMIADAIGKYHYDFDSSSIEPGDYEVKNTAKDGSIVTIAKDKFSLLT